MAVCPCSNSFSVSSMVRGYHIYKFIWTDCLVWNREDRNNNDRLAMAMIVNLLRFPFAVAMVIDL